MADGKYTDTGLRGEDPRHGFGDDMGTRLGRPDGAKEAHQAHRAPRDANPGQQPGQPGTNNDAAVADGLEGSILEGEGERQRDVQNASRHVDPEREAGNDRKIHDL